MADAWADAFGEGSSGAAGFKLPMALQEAELEPTAAEGGGVPRVWAFWAEAEAEVGGRAAAATPGDCVAAEVWNDTFGSDDGSDDDDDDDGGGKSGGGGDVEAARRAAWAEVLPPLLRAACPPLPLLRALQAPQTPPAAGAEATAAQAARLPAVQLPALVAAPGALQAQLDLRGYAVGGSDAATAAAAGNAAAAAAGADGCAAQPLGDAAPPDALLRHDDPALLAFVHGAVLALKRRQLAPAHVYLYDAAWELALRVWPLAEAVLGAGCLLEPSFAAFALDPQKAGTSYVGTNFGRPHRDYSYADSLEPTPEPSDSSEGVASAQALKVLSVWVPLNGVTTSNGCMYVVPRPCDGGFADPLGTEGLQSPRVPAERAGGVVALAPHPAGTFMCWTGNTVHWGSACGSGEAAADPRASLAFVFRRAGASLSVAEVSLTRADVAAADTATRLQWVRKAIGFFKHWYPDASLGYKGLPWAPEVSQLVPETGLGSGRRVAFS